MREVFLSLALLLPAWPASARMHAVRPPEKILWIGAHPDDEILIDALGMHSTAGLWHAFEAMMEMASSTGSHLVLQVHPERFHICEAALELLIERASDAGGWLTPLSEAADWVVRSAEGIRRWPGGHSFALSITGDLDAVSIGDFASRIWRK